MNLRSLQVFVQVLEEGTLARASEKMNLSQSAASRLLRILEEEYQTQLFLRDKKRLVPTPAGELFYPAAVRILSSIKAIPGLLADARDDNGAALRILCHPRLVSGLIVPAIIRFAELEPKVKLKLEVYPRRYLGQHILEGSFDIGVCNLPLPISDFKVEVVATHQVRVLLPREHPLATSEALGPDDVASMRYIALDETTLLRQLTDLEILRMGKALAVGYEVSSTSAAIGLVKAGLGFTLTEYGMVERDAAGGLVQIPWKPVTRMPIGCFLSEKSDPHPLTTLFRECLIRVGDAVDCARVGEAPIAGEGRI